MVAIGLEWSAAGPCGWCAGWSRCLGLQAAWAQTGDDGAIGGRVLSAAGDPVEGALVVARELETGLALRAFSGDAGRVSGSAAAGGRLCGDGRRRGRGG